MQQKPKSSWKDLFTLAPPSVSFGIPIQMDLYQDTTLHSTLSVYLSSKSKEISLPANITSVLVHCADTIPVIIQQIHQPTYAVSLQPLSSVSPAILEREIRSRYYLMYNREIDVKEVMIYNRDYP